MSDIKPISKGALSHLRSAADRMVAMDSPAIKADFWRDLQSALDELDARRKAEAGAHD